MSTGPRTDGRRRPAADASRIRAPVADPHAAAASASARPGEWVRNAAEPVPATPEDTAAASSARLVRTLSLTVFLQWLGASAIIPMLPEFVRRHGGTDGLAGVVMAAFFVAGVLSQYPAGWLADRVGRRTVLVGGLAVYALASLLFVAPVGAGVDVALRGLQGIGAGAAEVSSLAMVSATVAAERRGRAFASIYGGQIAGMAVGPLVGSIIGVDLMWVVFLGAAAASAAACVPASLATEPRRPASGGGGAPTPDGRGPTARRARLTAATLGALLAAAVIGLTSGVYETCWTLLLQHRGASNWAIGLSWTLFAVPFVLMTRPSGWLADHVDRRALALTGLGISIGFCTVYPFLSDPVLLVVLGAFEATGLAIAMPAAQSLLTQAAPPAELGRVQGLYSTSQTATTAVSAAAGGALFSLAIWAPFVVVAAASAALLPAIAATWSSVRGRVAESVAPGAAVPPSIPVRPPDPDRRVPHPGPAPPGPAGRPD